MKVLASIQIAGIDFILSCQDPLTIDSFFSEYEPFIKKTDSEIGSVAVNIDLTLNAIPHSRNLKKIFDTGQSWSLFMNEDGYFLAFGQTEPENKVVWTAHFHRDFESATIYCGDLVIQKEHDKTELVNPFSYPVDQIILMYFLSHLEGAIIHAAGINFNGKGYIFPGKSRAGKTTLSRQFVAKNHSGLLSDDRIVIRKIDTNFMAFGTPWPGEGKIAVNKSVSLNGIFFITHSSTNRIEQIKPQKAFEKLLPVVSIPWYDEEIMTKILSFCNDLISNIPAYELHFKPDAEVVDAFDKFVSQE